MKIKLECYKERKQKNDLDLKTKMPKWMTNVFFHRLKFKTIHLVIDVVANYGFSGLGRQQHSSILAGWNGIDTIKN